MMENKKLTIIGGGNLGVAIALGLIKGKGIAAQNITITRRNISSLQFLDSQGVHITTNNIEAAKNADIILLAIKPYQIAAVLAEIKDVLNENQLLISVVSSVSLAEITEMTQIKMPVFRAMPNTAIAIQQSMTCISYLNTTAEQNELVVSLFKNLGEAIVIEENLMEAATVLGACGTAYAMRYIRANIQGGIEIGFSAQTARLIAAQTVKGAAELLLQNGTHPEAEIDKVTTPKGCTIAGLNEMEHQGFSSSLIRGLIASYQKIRKD